MTADTKSVTNTVNNEQVDGLTAESEPTATATPTPVSNENVKLLLVSKVIDGDTLDLIINGKKESVRLIGVDTPEAVDPHKPVQCFAKEASAFTKAQLEGKRVRLEDY